MEKQREVIINILDLLTTTAEGIKYIREKLSETNPPATLRILLDTISAYSSIELAIHPILAKLPENRIEEKSKNLNIQLDLIVKEFETNDAKRALDIVQYRLEPEFVEWKKEIEKILIPYIAS